MFFATIKTEKGKDYIWGVFEKYIQSVPNCPKDVSFAKFALKRFMSEYCDLRNGNLDMSAMVRSAMKDGIHFEFYEKSAKNNISEDSIGCYNNKTKSVKFNCKNYVLDKRSCIHNTLAHELCHYSMDDNGKGYGCTFLTSDLGTLWCEIMKSESFLGVDGWKKTYQQNADKNKKLLYGNHSFFRNLRGEYKKSLFYGAQHAKKGEIFARVMGLFAKQKGGLDFVKKQDTKRLGLQVVCDMAMAHADNNDRKYQAIVDNLSKHKISPETMQAILNLKSCQEDISEKANFSERDYKSFMFYSCEVMKQVKKEFENFEAKVVNNNEVLEKQEKDVSEHATTLYDKLAKYSHSSINRRLNLREKQLEEKNQKPIQPQYPVVPVKPEISILARFKKALAEK